MGNLTNVSFTDKHLEVLVSALETFYRLKSGQIGIALDIAYDFKMSYDDKQEVEKQIRTFLDFPLPNNSYYSFSSPEIGDARIAGEIESVIKEYLSVKNNDGYWDEAKSVLKASEEPFPIIQGFQEFNSYPLTLEQSKEVIKFQKEKKYNEMWDYIHSIISLPKCDRSEIMESGGQISVICHKPRKN